MMRRFRRHPLSRGRPLEPYTLFWPSAAWTVSERIDGGGDEADLMILSPRLGSRVRGRCATASAASTRRSVVATVAHLSWGVYPPLQSFAHPFRCEPSIEVLLRPAGYLLTPSDRTSPLIQPPGAPIGVHFKCRRLWTFIIQTNREDFFAVQNLHVALRDPKDLSISASSVSSRVDPPLHFQLVRRNTKGASLSVMSLLPQKPSRSVTDPTMSPE